MSTKDAGVIIGKSGKNVSEIREQSGAKVTISEMIPGAYERILTVSGPLDTVAKVLYTFFYICYDMTIEMYLSLLRLTMLPLFTLLLLRPTRWLRRR